MIEWSEMPRKRNENLMRLQFRECQVIRSLVI